MFEIDHLMVEVEDPMAMAARVMERMQLPLAWPLMQNARHSSAGVNFGDLNIEFIDFRERFGVAGRKFSGFSGIALRATETLERASLALQRKGLRCRIGERAQAHACLVIEEEAVFPTVFLVEYKFDTGNWQQRLRREFAACHGGRHGLGRLRSLEIMQPLPPVLLAHAPLRQGPANRIVLESMKGHGVVINDLIEGLEIVVAQTG